MIPAVNTEGKYFKSIHALDAIVDKFEGILTGLKPLENENKYVIFAVRDLAWIALSVATTISRNIHWRYNAHTAATMTRLLMECVSEIKYIKSHPKKAKAFWISQQKIKEKLENADSDRWNLFADGSLSKFGQLSDSTNDRIKSSLGKDGLERYSFLNFYSHPNIAGYTWVSYDNTQPGKVVRFIAETFFKMLDEMLVQISTVEGHSIDIKNMREYLADAYAQYGDECKGEIKND